MIRDASMDQWIESNHIRLPSDFDKPNLYLISATLWMP